MGKQKEVNYLADNDLFKKLARGIYSSSCGQSFQNKNISIIVQYGAEQFSCCLSLQTTNVTIQFNELGHA